jgi:AcrR family transcriptional regulator
LRRERVGATAVAVADAEGMGALTMRRLARELGVEAMSLYHHVANKDDMLTGMVDLIFGEIGLPEGSDWRVAMRQRAVSAREVLSRHRWAIGLLDTRSAPGPATLRHHNAVTGVLRRGGFSVAMTAHAHALLDSYIYGFAIQEASLPFESPEGAAAVAEGILQYMSADEFPYLVEMATEHVLQPGYDFGEEFAFGLELILDGLDRLRRAG